MEILIQQLFDRLDQRLLDSELKKIRDITLDMEDIKMSLEELKSEVGLIDRLNPFSRSEEKQELKATQGELKFYKKEYNLITGQIRNHIHDVIESTPALQMKGIVSEMYFTLEDLRKKLKRKGVSSKMSQISLLESHVVEMNRLLSVEHGFEDSWLKKNEIVGLVMQRILDLPVKP